MVKKKSSKSNAASELESSVSPIAEINYKEPLFSLAAHPTRPILLSGLASGHLYCNTYDAEKLEEKQSESREKLALLEREAYKKGKINSVVKSVSQLKNKWWEVIADNTEIPEDSNIVTNWKTKRHKGSCRSVIFDPLQGSLGENLYSVGTDHIIKKASTETGKVLSKTSTLEHYPNPKDAITKLAHSASHPFLLTGTENGHVLIYDSKNLSSSQLKFKVLQAHEDSINDILPMPAVSAYHYLTLGSTTLSHLDIRKGIITQSDDQEDELLSMCYATDQINSNQNDTVLVSHGEGIVTIWKNSKNSFRDQLSRIKINKNASIDAIMPTMNCDTDEMMNSIWCGDSEGLLHRVNYKQGKVVETRVHSSTSGKYGAIDEVGILDIDYDYRLISAGMEGLKIWSGQEYEDLNQDEDSDEDDSDASADKDSEVDVGSNENDQWEDISSEEDAGSDVDDDNSDPESLGPSDFSDSESEDDKDAHKDDDIKEEADDEDDEEEEEDEKEDEEETTKPLDIVRKKRFDASKIKPRKRVIDINKLTESTASKAEPEEEPKIKKQKVKQLSAKQLKNAQQHEPGIRRFQGL